MIVILTRQEYNELLEEIDRLKCGETFKYNKVEPLEMDKYYYTMEIK